MAMTLETSRNEPAEPDLVAQARSGDSRACEALMRQHNQRLYRVARGILRDGFEAEDVVQETYVRAFTNLDRFTGSAGFSAWLTRIAINEALGRLRRRKRLVAMGIASVAPNPEGLDPTMTSIPSSQPDPERSAASIELRALIERSIDALPEQFRTVFILRAVEQLSVADTASCLGIPEQTVKSRYHRARALLQRALSDHIDAIWPQAFPFAGARCDRVVAHVLERLGRESGDLSSPAGSTGGTGPARETLPSD